MKQRIRIDGEYIYLALTEAELRSVLEDMVECGDLLSPQIEIVDNCVRFRDADIKMMQPELFFGKAEPHIKIDMQLWKTVAIFNVVMLFLFMLIYYFSAGNLDIGHRWLIFCGVMCVANSCVYLYLDGANKERHRKALYAKARLVSYFNATVQMDMTTSNNRLDRSRARLEKEYEIVKQMFQTLLEQQSSEVKARYKDNLYPDGDPVYEKTDDIKPKNLS